MRTFLFFLLILPSCIWGYTDKDKAVLDKKISNVPRQVPRFVKGDNEFLALCRAADIPCGLVYAEDAHTLAPGFRREGTFQGQTVRTILKSIVVRNPKYRWTIQKGVINLTPKVLFEDRRRYAEILGHPIEMVEATNKTMGEALVEISRQARLSCESLGESISGMVIPERHVTIQLSNMTFREALNEIVRTDGHAAWHLMVLNGKCSGDIAAQW